MTATLPNSLPRQPAAPCYHGGQFFSGVGEEFDSLERLQNIISADVLDAWFPPSPKAVAAIRKHLPNLLRSSPPANSAGLVRTIARVRGVPEEAVLPGAGSSDLIFLALRHWLDSESRVLILDPTYGEYAHILKHVVGCRIDRLNLSRPQNYRLDLSRLKNQLCMGYDLVVIVNPNNPTGQHVPREDLAAILQCCPIRTRCWIDETYVDYVGCAESLEHYAVASENVIICKSLSKCLALSGARVAYLCASPDQLAPLRAITPPWAVSLPAQVAAVFALQDLQYYKVKYSETRVLRKQLAQDLATLGWHTVPGVGNFLLCHLPSGGPDTPALVAKCREHGLYLRDVSTMSAQFDRHTLRIAVKDRLTNGRIVQILREAIFEMNHSHNTAPDMGKGEL